MEALNNSNRQPGHSLPLVSIGLAVYNGEKFLDEAIKSILNQTYQNLELIISDNASTDRTAEICKKYLENDSRIAYYRNSTNIGGANNENLTFTYAKGKYFRWAAHDDLLAPELIEKCVEVLESQPDVVLCHSITVLIDAEGQVLRNVSRTKAQSSRPSRRFADLAIVGGNSTEPDQDQNGTGAHQEIYGCEETYGLMRSSILRKTGLQRNYTDSDRTLLAHMSLYGKYYQVPEPLFYKRLHSQTSTQQFPEWRQRMQWFGEQYKNKIVLPYWSQLIHYLQLIATSPINLIEKFFCYYYMVKWVLVNRHWRSLGKDLILACLSLYFKLAHRNK